MRQSTMFLITLTFFPSLASLAFFLALITFYQVQRVHLQIGRRLRSLETEAGILVETVDHLLTLVEVDRRRIQALTNGLHATRRIVERREYQDEQMPETPTLNAQRRRSGTQRRGRTTSTLSELNHQDRSGRTPVTTSTPVSQSPFNLDAPEPQTSPPTANPLSPHSSSSPPYPSSLSSSSSSLSGGTLVDQIRTLSGATLVDSRSSESDIVPLLGLRRRRRVVFRSGGLTPIQNVRLEDLEAEMREVEGTWWRLEDGETSTSTRDEDL